MPTAQCSCLAWNDCTPSMFDIAVAQCMLPSPIRLNTASTPSLANACASIS
jgi:hypothetical protein